MSVKLIAERENGAFVKFKLAVCEKYFRLGDKTVTINFILADLIGQPSVAADKQ